ncbi:MAG TPA: hypothetical protein VJ932_09455 [Alkalispirochaeta sp.]|nr:hypothetical protein [Alkalispirochaeta sp.]
MTDQHDAIHSPVVSLPAQTPLQTLNKAATVLRAPLFKSESNRNGVAFRVVSIKDFPEAGYVPPPERVVRLTESADKAGRYTLHPYDVLVITVGSIGHVTVVPEDCEDNWIPATNMYVVRFDDDIPRRSRALYAVLKSPSGQSLLERMARGRGIQIVPKKVFSQIQVPVFNDDVLHITEQLWKQEQDLYQESLHKMEQCRTVYDAFEVADAESLAG